MKPLNVEHETCVVEGLPNTGKPELDRFDQNRKQVNKVLIYFADLAYQSLVVRLRFVLLEFETPNQLQP